MAFKNSTCVELFNSSDNNKEFTLKMLNELDVSMETEFSKRLELKVDCVYQLEISGSIFFDPL